MPKGEIALKLGHKAEEALKGAVSDVSLRIRPRKWALMVAAASAASLIFEEMGLRYLGPIDGHDLPLLVHALRYAKTCDMRSSCISLRKRQRLRCGDSISEKFHGTGPTTRDRIRPPPNPARPNYQDVFASMMVRLARRIHRSSELPPPCRRGTGLKALEKHAARY